MTRWLVTISCGIVQTLPPEMGVAGISLSKNLDCRLLRFLQNTCIHVFRAFFLAHAGSRFACAVRLAGSGRTKRFMLRIVHLVQHETILSQRTRVTQPIPSSSPTHVGTNSVCVFRLTRSIEHKPLPRVGRRTPLTRLPCAPLLDTSQRQKWAGRKPSTRRSPPTTNEHVGKQKDTANHTSLAKVQHGGE